MEQRALLSGNSPAGPVPLGPLEVDHQSYDPSSLLVRFRDDVAASAVDPGQFDQHGLAPGTRIGQAFSLVSGLRKVQLDPGIRVEDALAAYQANPNVLYAEPNYLVRLAALPDDPLLSQLWGLENEGQTGGALDADIDAALAWDVTAGAADTIVAVIDTGVDYTHEDLAANIWVNPGEIPGDGLDNDGNGFIDDVHGYDFANDDADPMDDHSHGTHVAGTIGAVGNNGLGVSGVNWSVKIMAVKFLDASGNGTLSDAVDAVSYAVNSGATISNNSWGGYNEYSQALRDTIESAQAVGHIFVAGAGNGNWLGIGQDIEQNEFHPASYTLDNIVAVAATDHNDQLASFSNYGAASVDLAAPGVNILSTTPGNGYGLMSGTSMATPHVTGVLAMVRSLHPEWTYQQVISQVLETADPLPWLEGLTVTGGRLNAAAAVGNPEPPPPPPPPASLPLAEDFAEGIADHFLVESGHWSTGGGRYHATPQVDDDDLDAISTVTFDSPLPADLDIRATINADEGRIELLGIVLSDFLTNGFVVFDFQSDTDYKFAGADMDADQWIIGHYDGSSWTADASLSQTINAVTNYQVRVVVEDASTVSLEVDGVPKLTYAYAGPVNDGLIGLGMRNSTTHFDDFSVQQYVPPPPPVPLPVEEDFEDGVADSFYPRQGSWQVESGRYAVTPVMGKDGVSTLRIEEPLPADLEILATINADPATSGRYSNAFVILDYHSPTDFKFAGACAGSDDWLIGHRTTSGWQTDAILSEPIQASTDYHLQVIVQGDDQVTLVVDEVERVVHQFADPVTDGEVGLGTWEAISQFDDVLVREYVPPPPPPWTTLPVEEDFEDGAADFFQVEQGSWQVESGRYAVTPVLDQDGVSTLRIEEPLPADLEIWATINANAGASGRLSNAFVILDYHGPTDFKFAGACVGSDDWVIGRRTTSGWQFDEIVSEAIQAVTDYQLQVIVQGDDQVTLLADGVERVVHQFADPVTDGAVGLGTWDALSRFDDVLVQEYVPPPPPPPPPSATLPVEEDFEDGVADFFQAEQGTWQVESGRYAVTPVLDQDGVSTLRIEEPLPADLEIWATINANAGTPGRYSNAFVILDYQGPTDFKFAGACVGSDDWVIGRRTASGWQFDEIVSEAIQAVTDYQLQVIVQGDDQVTLVVDGVERVVHQFADPVTDGAVGLGTWDALSRFDDVLVQEYVPPPPPPSATLPVEEDFDDGVADFFRAEQGTWQVESGRYAVTPVMDQDGVSTLRIEEPLPADLEIWATINANAGTPGRYSNAFVILDYHGPTDFKFAGACVGSDDWVIGRRTASGWQFDAIVSQPIQAVTDYRLQVIVQGGDQVTLLADGVERVVHQFADPVTDGAVGLGTWDALSRFDDVIVDQPTAAAAVAAPGPLESSRIDPFSSHDGLIAWLAQELAERGGASSPGRERAQWVRAIDEALRDWALLWLQ